MELGVVLTESAFRIGSLQGQFSGPIERSCLAKLTRALVVGSKEPVLNLNQMLAQDLVARRADQALSDNGFQLSGSEEVPSGRKSLHVSP
jgi:hypothetical protein